MTHIYLYVCYKELCTVCLVTLNKVFEECFLNLTFLMGGVDVFGGGLSGHPSRASRVLEPVVYDTHMLHACYKQLSTDC